MTYHQHIAELARALAALVAAPDQPPPASELAAVEAYRTDLLDALTDLHRTLFPAGRKWLPTVAAGDVELEPLSALGSLLASYPRGVPSTLAPTDRAQLRALSPTGRQWQAVATHAILAGDDAAHLHPGWDTDPAAGWQAIADLADLTVAVAIADHDLTLALQRTGDAPGRPAGLRLAAEQCARLARSGPLSHVDDAYAAADPPAVPMVVAGAADLEPAQHRLAVILHAADPPCPPVLLAHIATGQARAHVSAAHLLQDAGDRDPAYAKRYQQAAIALRSRAGDLTNVANSCRTIGSPAVGRDLRPVFQTAEIMRALHHMEGDLTAAEPASRTTRHVLAWARRGSDVITAINSTVTRAMQSGQYLALNPLDRRDLGQTRWVPARLLPEPPPLITAASQAAQRDPDNAAVIAQAATPVAQPSTTRADIAALAIGNLQKVLTERALTRPPRPGDPTPGFTPTRPAGAPRR